MPFFNFTQNEQLISVCIIDKIHQFSGTCEELCWYT